MNIEWYPERNAQQAEYTGKMSLYRSAMVELWRDMQTTVEDMDTPVTIKGRVKSFPSYFEKLLSRLEKRHVSGVMEPIHDIIALRVVCPFMEDLAGVEQRLRAKYTIVDMEHKGENHTIGEFGYSCVHLVFAIPKRVRQKVHGLDLETAEVQIRTILQDAWAEVEHELIYKSQIAPLDSPLRRKLAALNATLSLSDITFQEIRDYQRKLNKELEKRRLSFDVENTEKLSESFIDGDEERAEDDVSLNSEHEDTTTSAQTVPRSMDELLVDALHAHNRRHFPTAIKLYSRILQTSTEPRLKAIVLIHRGIAHFCQAHYEQAFEDFATAAHCEPENGKAFYHLGTVNRVLGDHAAAVRHLRKSVELNPYRLEALVGLASAFFELGDYPAVLEYCERALRIKPDIPSARKLRSAALMKIGDGGVR